MNMPAGTGTIICPVSFKKIRRSAVAAYNRKRLGILGATFDFPSSEDIACTRIPRWEAESWEVSCAHNGLTNECPDLPPPPPEASPSPNFRGRGLVSYDTPYRYPVLPQSL